MVRPISIILCAMALFGLAACAPAAAPTTAPAGSASSSSSSSAPVPTTVPAISTPALAPTVATAPTLESSSSSSATSSSSSSSSTSAIATAPAAGTTEATTAVTPAATTSAEQSSNSSSSSSSSSAAQSSTAASSTPSVTATEFKFDPSTITVQAGQTVTLTFVNKGSVDHELEAEDLKVTDANLDLSQAGKIPEDERDEAMGDVSQGEVHMYAAPGGTAVLTFTPTTPGTYDFACNLEGHKEAGMTGQIVVLP